MEKREIKKQIEMKPATGNCWQNKRGHNFIHTIKHTGLPLYIEDTEESIEKFNENYKQVKIK